MHQLSIPKGELEQQIQELADTIQQLRQSQIALAAENERLREGQAGVQALAQSVGELAQSLKRDAMDATDRKILMDTEGLGRPEVFDNKEESFRRWIRSINNLVAGVFGPDYDEVLESCGSRRPHRPSRFGQQSTPRCGEHRKGYAPGTVKTLLLELVMAMKPIGSFVGDGAPPRAGGKETSYGPS